MKEIDATYDKIFPKMAEPEEKGIDLHVVDFKHRFIAVVARATFRKVDTVTEEKKAKFETMWKVMTGGNYSPEKKKDKKPEKKRYQ